MELKYFITIILTVQWTLPLVKSQSSTGTATQGCANYQTLPGKQALGATAAVPDIPTQAACIQTCIDDSTCNACEFDTDPPTGSHCWIHRNVVNTGDLYDDPTITLFVMNSRFPCPSGSSGGSSTTALTSTTTGPTTTLGSAACASFTMYQGQHALGATPLAGANTNQLCLDQCVFNPQCLAYEFNPNGSPPCWYHTNVVNPDTDLFNDDPGINIFIAQRFPCTSTTSGTTTTGSSLTSITSTTTGPTASDGTCFQTYTDTNALFAQQFTEARTVDECQTTCLGRSTCSAFETDFIIGVFRCWLHLSPLGELFTTAGVTIHIRVPCSSTGTTQSTTSGSPSGQCVTYGAPLIDTQSTGATGRGNISDAACQQICTNDPTCVCYEIDHVLPDRCWIHTDIRDLSVVYDTRFVDQYRVTFRGPCGQSSTSGSSISSTSGTTVPGVCANYLTVPNTQSLNGIGQPGITNPNRAACEAICTGNANCVCYETDTDPTSPFYCWIHTAASDLLQLFDSQTVTQYQVIDRNCASGSSTSGSTGSSGSSSTTGSTVSGSSSGTSGSSGSSGSSTGSGGSGSSGSSTSGTTGTSASTTAPAGQCTVTWASTANMNQPGGTPNRASDLPSCQQACVNNVNCIAIDVAQNTDNFFCYLIFTDVPLASFPGNTNYRITRGPNCATASSTLSSTTMSTTVTAYNPNQGCENYRVVVGYNADGGNMIGQMSLNDCLVACVRDPTCNAIDYAVDNRLCFTHTSLSGGQLSQCCIRYECASSPCTDTFAKYTDTSPSLGLGQVQNSVTTQSDCQAACLAKNCSRYSFINAARVPSQSCYLFFANGSATAGREATSTQVGIDLYVRKRCIASPVVPPTTASTIPPSLSPNYCPIDLVFVIDSSGSIKDNQPPGVDNWALIKAYVKDFINTYLLIGLQTDRVAIVTFSDTAIANFNFNRYTDATSLSAAVDNLPFIGYETNTPAALTLASTYFSDASQGARTRSTKICVLITDGVVSPQWTSQYPASITTISQYCKARYAIGVTTQISTSELYAYTGSRDAYTTVLSFQDLSKVSGLGIYLNSVDCNGNIILTSPLSSSVTAGPPGVSSSTVSGGSGGGSSTTGSGQGGNSSTSLSTVTSASTSPTTTIPNGPPRGAEGCFGAVTRTAGTGQLNPVHFTQLYANRFNVYVTQSDSFIATDFSGFYFIIICSGAASGTSTEVSTRGAFPAFAFTWLSKTHTGNLNSCRSGVLSMTRGVRVFLQQTGDGAFSDNNVQTSWSMFSITDIISDPNTILSAYINTRSPISAPVVIPFADPVSNPQDWYDAARYQFVCRTSGVYFFSFSVGVAGATTGSARLIGMSNVFEITMASNTHNSIVTLDRSVVANCLNGRVSVQVTTGQVSPGAASENLISFQAFPYLLRDGLPGAAWGLYRTSSLSLSAAAVDPLPFDLADVTQGVTFSGNTVTLTLPGYYYVYISAGCPAAQRVSLTLRVNSQIMFSVNRLGSNSNGIYTIGQGLVMRLNATDVLKVVAEANSAVYSTQDGLHTSFVGIRLYAPEN